MRLTHGGLEPNYWADFDSAFLQEFFPTNNLDRVWSE